MLKSLCCLLTLLCAPVSALALDAGDSAQPAGLYMRYCASCHGPDARGDGEDAAMFDPKPRNLRDGILDRYPVADLARRVRTGALLTLSIDIDALRQHASDTEEIVAYLKRLPTIRWTRVEAGWELYAARCQACHGSSGEPEELPHGVTKPRDLSSAAFQRSMDEDELVEAVRHGRQGMPALTPRVSIQQGQQIAAFVRLLSPGFELYTRYCANCHADDGRGAQSLGEVLGEAIALPAIVFDRRFFASRTPEQLRQAVWHMLDTHQPQMPHFRYLLSQGQLEAIISYLKAKPATP